MAVSLAETARWFFITTAELAALFLALSYLVGLLQAWIPQERIRSLFETKKPATGYLAGAILGAVTPFCSYSTIPVLAGLLRSGAPFGPTITFLFSSPLLDPVALGVMVFLVGAEGAIIYAVLTFAASILVGVIFERLQLEEDVRALSEAHPGDDPAGCEASEAKRSVWRRAWDDAWAFFLPALPYLLIGTAAGAAVYGFVPSGWLVALAGPGQPLAIPLSAALGIPMYVNAETFFPISAALLDKGVGVGAVVALIVTGMGVSIPEIVLLGTLFRWRLVGAVVASVFVVAVGGGALFAFALD